MARCRRHTRSAEAGGARVWRVVFFPAERVYRGGESREVGRGRDAMSDLMLLWVGVRGAALGASTTPYRWELAAPVELKVYLQFRD